MQVLVAIAAVFVESIRWTGCLYVPLFLTKKGVRTAALNEGMRARIENKKKTESGTTVTRRGFHARCMRMQREKRCIHANTIANGVSLHTRGVRYSLFFLQAPASTGSEHERMSLSSSVEPEFILHG